MTGVIRALPSQPLCSLAPKPASGGKIRARRFAPAWSADKPLYRFGKIRHRGQTRVGARILANTIGNLVADGIAGGGKPTNLLEGTPYDGPGDSSANSANLTYESGIPQNGTDGPPSPDEVYVGGDAIANDRIPYTLSDIYGENIGYGRSGYRFAIRPLGKGFSGYPTALPPMIDPKDGAASGEFMSAYGDHPDRSGGDFWAALILRQSAIAATNRLSRSYPLAARFMSHYLDASGSDLTLPVNQMISSDEGISDAYYTTKRIMDIEAIKYNSQYGANAFVVSSGWFGAESKPNTDYFFAFGSFSMSIETAYKFDNSSIHKFMSSASQVYVFDRYNWDQGKSVTIPAAQMSGVPRFFRKIPDSMPGMLNKYGMAQVFNITGTGRRFSYPVQVGGELMRVALFLILSSIAMSACSGNDRNQSACGIEGGDADVESAKRNYRLPQHFQNINIGINGIQDKVTYIYFELDQKYANELNSFKSKFISGRFIFEIKDNAKESLCFKWWDRKKYYGVYESYESRTENSLQTYFIAKRSGKFLVWISSTN